MIDKNLLSDLEANQGKDVILNTKDGTINCKIDRIDLSANTLTYSKAIRLLKRKNIKGEDVSNLSEDTISLDDITDVSMTL